jgi:phage N-6-adenine-methyltransferase
VNLAPMMSSAKDDWQTPDVVLDLVRELGPIALDPCSSGSDAVGATLSYTAGGLESDWVRDSFGGTVYVNPPYGRDIGCWTSKANESGGGAQIVALLPARTDTMWWQRDVVCADAICFWRGRLTFKGAPAPAPFPSAIAYWGERGKAFGRVFAPHGWVVKP